MKIINFLNRTVNLVYRFVCHRNSVTTLKELNYWKIVSGSKDGSIRIWDADFKDSKCIEILNKKSEEISTNYFALNKSLQINVVK